jgi:hypothetical protein
VAYRPHFLTHATTLAQRFLLRPSGARELDHVVLTGLAALSYLNVWVVNASTTDAALAGAALAASARWDRVPVGINGGASLVVPLGIPVGDFFDTDGRTPVGGVVVSLSSGDAATGDLAAAVAASYRWIV